MQNMQKEILRHLKVFGTFDYGNGMSWNEIAVRLEISNIYKSLNSWLTKSERWTDTFRLCNVYIKW
jgi:hypothetical protein